MDKQDLISILQQSEQNSLLIQLNVIAMNEMSPLKQANTQLFVRIDLKQFYDEYKIRFANDGMQQKIEPIQHLKKIDWSSFSEILKKNVTKITDLSFKSMCQSYQIFIH